MIAERLCRDALWFEDRCTWLNAERADGIDKYMPLDGSYYEGTSGIAYYLARAYTATGRHVLRKTARGAIHHALRSPIALSGRHGLYTGALGIGLVSVWVGSLVDCDDIRHRGLKLVDGLLPELNSEKMVDVLSGLAGMIYGLTCLWRETGSARYLELAIKMGDELVARSTAYRGTMSWTVSGIRSWRPLIGFSHGAAGIAAALDVLGKAADSHYFCEAAGQARAYERMHFQAEKGNWPDFRVKDRGSRRPPVAFTTTWCHGAPGVALSRLVSCQTGMADDVREEALVGLATTDSFVTTSLSTQNANYSLCHGLAGNASVLIEGQRVLGFQSSAVAKVAQNGIERHRVQGFWPCGTSTGDHPGLFLGRAGIGYFYLALAEAGRVDPLTFDVGSLATC